MLLKCPSLDGWFLSLVVNNVPVGPGLVSVPVVALGLDPLQRNLRKGWSKHFKGKQEFLLKGSRLPCPLCCPPCGLSSALQQQGSLRRCRLYVENPI